MAEEQDPEVPDVPEHDLSEEDMMFVSLLYNYILALRRRRGGKNSKDKGRLTYLQEGEDHLSGVALTFKILLKQCNERSSRSAIYRDGDKAWVS